MFQKMRRKRQELSYEETVEIMKRNRTGVLALSEEGGYPYAVPVNYVYADGKLIFHGAKSGQKIEMIRKNKKASFCIIDQDQLVAEEYTTYFRSVIAFGKIQEITEWENMYADMVLLSQSVREGFKKEMEDEIERGKAALCVCEFEIEHVTGKEAIELVKGRRNI